MTYVNDRRNARRRSEVASNSALVTFFFATVFTDGGAGMHSATTIQSKLSCVLFVMIFSTINGN